MPHRALVLPWLLGCSGAARPAPTAPLDPPAPSTVCYAGLRTGMGQTARTIVRRTIDPAARRITEEVNLEGGGAIGPSSFHVVMTVDGDRFAMTETGGAFHGSGTLVGDPWRWTSWTMISQRPDGLAVESEHELTATAMTATKQIKRAGAVVGTTSEELRPFDCTAWDETEATLAVPVLDAAACDRACRNFATLRYWARADAQLATVPAADRASARIEHEAELTRQLAAGVEACVEGCLGAGNAVQTACLASASSVEQLAACD